MTALALIRPDFLDVVDHGEEGVVGPGSHPARTVPDRGPGGEGVAGTGSHPARSAPSRVSDGQGVVGGGGRRGRTVPNPALPTLEAALLALMRGELRECLVCGEPVEGDEERVECAACGSVLEPAPREVIPGQLELLDC
jgi:hypothetical protein